MSLQKLLQELDFCNQVELRNKFDSKLFRYMLAKERVYNFLASLNSSLDEVRGRILGMKPLPIIDEVFAKVRREEHRKQIMLSQQSSSFPWEPAALVSNDAINKKGSRWCEHYQRPNHTKVTCWKLHGKPADCVLLCLRGCDGKTPNTSPYTATTASNAPFSKAQLDHLTKLLHNSHLDASGSFHLAQIGTLTTDLVSPTDKGPDFSTED